MSVLADFANPVDPGVCFGPDLNHSRLQALVECAVLAYKPPEEIRAAAGGIQWLEATGPGVDSQAFACVLPGHVILAFRGTSNIRDFLTDAVAIPRALKNFDGVDSEFKVHMGFQRALNALWSDQRSARRGAKRIEGPELTKFLADAAANDPGAKLWLTGHSLGAALATITAARIQLTPGAPFNGRIGGLVTIGSPRALSRSGADALEAALGRDRIFRIYRSLDPVVWVPFLNYEHATGARRAFVTRAGHLVMDTSVHLKQLDRVAAALRWTEDHVGAMIPGQHAGPDGLVSDHSSASYLAAVSTYKEENKQRTMDYIGPIAAPILKLGGLGAAGTAGAANFVDGLMGFLR